MESRQLASDREGLHTTKGRLTCHDLAQRESTLVIDRVSDMQTCRNTVNLPLLRITSGAIKRGVPQNVNVLSGTNLAIV